MQQDQTVTGTTGYDDGTSERGDLRREIARLRRTLLKHGHAQELFQQRVEGAIERMEPKPAPVEASQPSPPKPGVSAAQKRTLVELAQAVSNLRALATGAATVPTGDVDSPRSIREGLDLLEIRVNNLQRSFGIEKIPTVGRPFDDRIHRAHGVVSRADLPDGQVVEELLPGYLLDGELERPALVIVNRLERSRDTMGGPG